MKKSRKKVLEKLQKEPAKDFLRQTLNLGGSIPNSVEKDSKLAPIRQHFAYQHSQKERILKAYHPNAVVLQHKRYKSWKKNK
jgi:hypothetical protein